MSIHPDSSFPLLASDQADVIHMFLELMEEASHSGTVSEVTTTNDPLGPGNDSQD